MSLADYQKKVDKSLEHLEKPYWHPLSQLARIIEEVGETARILNHKYGDKPKKKDEDLGDLAEELADILYATMALANSEGIDLDAAMQEVLKKPLTRDKDRYARKTAG